MLRNVGTCRVCKEIGLVVVMYMYVTAFSEIFFVLAICCYMYPFVDIPIVEQNE